MCIRDRDDGIRVVAVLAFDADGMLAVGRSVPATGAYPSLLSLIHISEPTRPY